MKLFGLVLGLVAATCAQNIPGYEEVTKKPLTDYGALQKCGEGDDQGVHVCVPYYNCDGVTRTIIVTGESDGFGVIDIRFGTNSCTHPLDVCCKIPEGGIPPIITTPTPPQPTLPPTRPPHTGGGDENVPPLWKPCGIRNPNGIDFKISGNSDNEAEYGEFPWMMAILRKHHDPSSKDTLAVCGGSLIAPNVVLTGAHCIHKFKSDEIKVRGGEWDTQTVKERVPFQEIDVAQIIIHKDFAVGTLYHDVALLILSSSFIPAENIGTVCLPTQAQQLHSKNCFASGWGKDKFGAQGQFQVILKKIELPLVPFDQCQTAMRTTRLGKHFVLHDSFVCAGGQEGKDTCTGDGGSPLVCPDPNNPEHYLQAGIVAWGIGCGEHGIPGVYAKVPNYREWIDEQFQKLSIENKHYRA